MFFLDCARREGERSKRKDFLQFLYLGGAKSKKVKQTAIVNMMCYSNLQYAICQKECFGYL
jgi:hypothetical protein